MSRESSKNLKEYFKEVYPHIWEHYKFLYERRIVDTYNNFNFLLLINTLMIIIFFEFISELLAITPLFYLTLLFLLLPILIYFIYLFQKRLFVPWFEKENLKEVWKDNNFYEAGLKSIYGVAPSLWKYIVNRKKWYRVSIDLLVLSIFSIPLIFISLFSHWIISLDASVIIFFIIYVIDKYFDKTLDNSTKEVEDFFDKWKKEK